MSFLLQSEVYSQFRSEIILTTFNSAHYKRPHEGQDQEDNIEELLSQGKRKGIGVDLDSNLVIAGFLSYDTLDDERGIELAGSLIRRAEKRTEEESIIEKTDDGGLIYVLKSNKQKGFKMIPNNSKVYSREKIGELSKEIERTFLASGIDHFEIRDLSSRLIGEICPEHTSNLGESSHLDVGEMFNVLMNYSEPDDEGQEPYKFARLKQNIIPGIRMGNINNPPENS
jgi:hypothetical protein